MTTKEKAIAYDEILNKLRHLIAQDVDPLITRADVQDFFPELKESEDEEIRKEMLKIAKESEDSFYMVMTPNKRKKLIAWLEKQGQVKESLISQYENKMCKENDDSLTSGDERIRKGIISAIKEDWPGHTDWIAWLEKQGKDNMGISEATKKKLEDNLNEALEKETPESWNKFLDEGDEQKPVWSEEDEQYLLVCKNALAKYQRTDKWDASIISRWLESLKDKVQPNQEWSEEDEEALEEVRINFEINKGKMTPALQKCYDRFFDKIKTLNQYLKQEWSEEDEKKLLCICAWIKDYPRIADFKDEMYTVANNYIDWLKSLRPQNTWKPSDEQMEALDSTLQYSQVSHNSYEHLNSLFNDLKKLREE